MRQSSEPLFGITGGFAQVPEYFVVDTALNARLHEIVESLGLDKDFDVGEDGIEQISLAVVDLTTEEPRLGGVHFDNFIYPASSPISWSIPG